ncbi:hypothetical protein DB30_00896 [Enhygromyxa salina]|uniref:Uncharacterized protein n=1 Tax=Enhygromyxa salina TaxID=215803 RepID=A0A0C2CTJ5_9BACT|nr:hypothetical protein DB30_00896 [Enhygromyxa salina]
MPLTLALGCAPIDTEDGGHETEITSRANATGDDLPLGIVSTIHATQAGTANLRVVLRHLPTLNGTAQKTSELPESLAAGEALPGEVDVDVSFELTIQ